ncbi:MAG: zinc-dependent peptidase [Gammaproteobacteria bacterium]|nr:zinc-dependent peptidase [Gammaproteobacteria bacterium]
MLLVYFASIAAIICTWLLWRKMRTILRARRRTRLLAQPLPTEWQALLQRYVALYLRLPGELREKLHGQINYFLQDKHFVGRNGQQIDDKIRLTIAGNACLLALGHEREIFTNFKTILVYPEAFIAKQVSHDGSIVHHAKTARAGESWHRGPLVLSWQAVLQGSIDGYDGHNVVLHEFAHKLDEENITTNGTPLLRDSSHYAQWVEVLNKEYGEFLQRVERRSNKVIDAYGAESPPEFFAVASETFFEKPVLMQQRLPDLYEQLQRYYAVDPASWH